MNAPTSVFYLVINLKKTEYGHLKRSYWSIFNFQILDELERPFLLQIIYLILLKSLDRTQFLPALTSDPRGDK